MAKPGWQRRNELARSKGYKSYYDYRVHDYGHRAPGEPRLRGEGLRQARGHASYADLLGTILSGQVEIISQVPGRRNPVTGEIDEVLVDVMLSDGTTRAYRLRGRQLERDRVKILRLAVAGTGADVYTSPSPDVLKLASLDGEYEEGSIATDMDYDFGGAA